MLCYLPITPTVSRWDVWPEASKANGLIHDFTQKKEHICYIEATHYFLDGDKNPRKELFFWDGTHLNKQGYAIWASIVRQTLLQKLSINS